ncbi:MAG: DUF1269 domain-containing protein [Gemmataceae bacterium]
MSTLVIIGYEDMLKAEEVRLTLLRLQEEYLIDLEDAVVVVRGEDGKVKLRQLYDLTTAGAVSGGFWGSLIGVLFLSPLLGLAVGAATGAVSGALSDVGINNDFMKQLGETLKPETSALCVLVRKSTPDKVVEEIQKYGGTILKSSLSHEDEEKLQEALSAGNKPEA